MILANVFKSIVKPFSMQKLKEKTLNQMMVLDKIFMKAVLQNIINMQQKIFLTA